MIPNTTKQNCALHKYFKFVMLEQAFPIKTYRINGGPLNNEMLAASARARMCVCIRARKYVCLMIL